MIQAIKYPSYDPIIDDEMCHLYTLVDETYLGTSSMHYDSGESKKYEVVRDIGGPFGALKVVVSIFFDTPPVPF